MVGAGGIYLEYDTRDVPDVATVAADYDEGCQLLISSTMCNDHRIEECIRGHSATLVFDSKPTDPKNPKSPREFGYMVLPQNVQSAPRGPSGDISKEGTWVPGGLQPLGTDGLGRSDDRKSLRRFFEVDAECIAVAVLWKLAQRGEINPRQVQTAIRELGIDPEKANPSRI